MVVNKHYIWLVLILSTFFNTGGYAQNPVITGDLVFDLGSETVCQGTLVQLTLELDVVPNSDYYQWSSSLVDASGAVTTVQDYQTNIIGDGNGGSGNGDDHTFIRIPLNDPGEITITVDIQQTKFSTTITVVEAPNAGQDANLFLCNKTGVISLFDELSGDPDAGGSWTFEGSPHSGNFTVGTDEEGIYTYLVSGQGPCPDTDSRVIVRNCSNPDYDNDGVPNEVDLDDDNDGILDVDENMACSAAELTPTQSSVDEDFGIGPPTQNSFVSADLTYQIGIPQDVNNNNGEYNVATATYMYNFGNQSAFWVSTDENNFWDGDDNVDGRFLSINMKTASFIDAVIYEQSDLPVTPGVLQTLSMKIANLSTGVIPSFKLQIVTNAGVVIEEVDSVDADLMDIDIWNDYTISFTPDPGVEIVTLRLINTQSMSGNGNDVGIDNILLARLECDSDLDGVPNYIDRDSDNDGVFDAVEAGFLENQVGADGQLVGAVDADGVPVAANGGVSLANDNYLNLDSDGDGCSDANEAYFDSGADGTVESTNASETQVYGIDPFDFADVVDFDGLIIEAPYTYPVDFDNDGTLDYVQVGGPDSNNNGVSDACEDNPDNDEDGFPDDVDLDDDNDGILDADENICTVINTSRNTGDYDVTVFEAASGVSSAYSTITGLTNSADISSVSGLTSAGTFTYDEYSGTGNSLSINFAITERDQLSTEFGVNVSETSEEIALLFEKTLTADEAGVYDIIRNPFISIGNVDRALDNFAVIFLNGSQIYASEESAFSIANGIDVNNLSLSAGDVLEFLVYESDFYNGDPTEPVKMVIGYSIGGCDSDNDGIINQFDLDSDNDGIYDYVEAGEALNSGVGNGLLSTTVDVDANGVPNAAGGGLSVVNTDGDTKYDFLDIDSDGDGIPDNLEAQPTVGYIAPSGSDSDDNGVDDAYDANGTEINPISTGAGVADYLNINSDDDCLDDVDEAYDLDEDGISDITAQDLDTDDDGLDDAFDTVTSSFGTAYSNSANGQLVANFPDNHNPGGDVDYREEYIEVTEEITDPEELCESADPFRLFSLIETLTTNENGLWSGPSATDEPFDWEIDPSTDTEGEYVYTITLGDCESTYTVNIEISPEPFTGLENPDVASVCSSDTAFSLYDNLLPDGTTLPDVDGEWTSDDVTVLPATFDGTIDLTTIPATLLGVDITFTYSVGSDTCFSETDLTINLSANRNAGTADTAIPPICVIETSTDNLFTYLAGAESGGAWSSTDDTVTDFTGDSLGIINPSLLTPGTYQYTYELLPIGSCLGDTETIEIEILAEPFTGLDNPAVIPACSSDTAFSLYDNLLPNGTTLPDANGTWSSDDVTVLPATFDGTIDLTSIPATLLGTDVTFTYTVGSDTCFSETDLTINLSSNRNAGTADTGIEPICILETSTDNLFTYLTGAESGGEWSSTDDTVTDFTGDSLGVINPSLLAPGVYVYTYELLAIGSCLGDTETVEITITAEPNAGTDNAEDVCFSERVLTLADYLGGTPDNTGTWFYADGTEIGDFATGTVDTENITSGDEFTYRVGTVDCFDEAIVTINIIESPNPGAQMTPIVACGSSDDAVDLFAVLDGADAGGTWSEGNGTIIPSSLAAGDYVYTYTLTGTNGCPDAEANVEFTITPILSAGENAQVTLCREVGVDVDLFDFLGANAMPGGTWISESGSVTFSTDRGALTLIDSNILDDDRYIYTVSSSVDGACDDVTAFIDLKLTEDRDAGADPAPITVCTSETDSIDLFSELSIPDTDGVWSGGTTEGGHLGTFVISETATPPGDYTFTYTLPAIGTCDEDEVTVVVTVVTATTPTNPTNEEVCEGDPNPQLSVDVDAGLSANWYFGAADGPLVQADSTTFTPTETNVGGYTYFVYSFNSATGCESSEPLEVTFTIHGIFPVDLIEEEIVCEGESITIDSTLADGSFNFQWFNDNGAIVGATSSTYDATEAGNYYVEYESLTLSNSSTGTLCKQQSSNSTRIILIEQASDLELSLGAEGFSNFNSITATFVGDSNGEYEADLDGAVFKLADPNGPIVFENVSPGLHFVTITDLNGCGLSLTAEIFVIGFPKFFTPNGDLQNDDWNVLLDPSEPMDISIFVYDRFGKLIQQVFPDKAGWDGTFAGKDMPSDDYWFLATLNETGATFASHFTLIR